MNVNGRCECMKVNIIVEKAKGFSKKKPFAVVRATKNDNPLLNAMFGYNNQYIAVFNISLVFPQKDWEDEDADLDEFFKKFKTIVKENAESFKFYDFTISELTGGACNSVLIVATKQTMAVRRILSLTDKQTSLAVAKQNVMAAISKKRYKPLNDEEIEKLKNSKTDKEDDETEDDEE